MNDEVRLKQKLRAIEALFAGAATDGERDAADRARLRILQAIADRRDEVGIEWQFSVDPWSRRLLVALARRYNLQPYRYRRQRHSTLVIRAPERFLKQTFLPAYDQMVATLHEHLGAVTDRVVGEVLHADASEPAEVDQAPRQLEAFSKSDGD